MTDRNTGTTTIRHNALVNATLEIDASNRTVTFEYDRLGRLRFKRSNGQVGETIYDDAIQRYGGCRIQVSYDGVRRHSSTTNLDALTLSGGKSGMSSLRRPLELDGFGRPEALRSIHIPRGGSATPPGSSTLRRGSRAGPVELGPYALEGERKECSGAAEAGRVRR